MKVARDGVAGGWWYCLVWRTMFTSKFISHAADLGDKAQPLWSAPQGVKRGNRMARAMS